MAEINIRELREKIARATPAPLEVVFEPGKHIVIGSLAEHTGVCIIFNDAHDLEYKQDNAALIVAAVNNLAALCDEVERLRKICEHSLECLRGWKAYHTDQWDNFDAEAVSELCRALGINNKDE